MAGLITALVIAVLYGARSIESTISQSKSGFPLGTGLRTSPSLNKARSMPRTENLEKTLGLTYSGWQFHVNHPIKVQKQKRPAPRATPLSSPCSHFSHDWACFTICIYPASYLKSSTIVREQSTLRASGSRISETHI